MLLGSLDRGTGLQRLVGGRPASDEGNQGDEREEDAADQEKPPPAPRPQPARSRPGRFRGLLGAGPQGYLRASFLAWDRLRPRSRFFDPLPSAPFPFVAAYSLVR